MLAKIYLKNNMKIKNKTMPDKVIKIYKLKKFIFFISFFKRIISIIHCKIIIKEILKRSNLFVKLIFPLN